MKSVSYERQTVDSPNPIARFAHRKRLAVSLALTDRHLPRGGSIVDFGAGKGLFLMSLNQTRPDAQLYGVEPFMTPTDKVARYVPSLAALPSASQDIVTAFEVCEHLYANELDALLADANRVLSNTGKLIVSVPIMYGLSVLLKEPSRMLLHRRRSEYSVGELLSSSIGNRVSRPENPRLTHKGFDFRELREKLRGHFEVCIELLSPFNALPWWLNSQIFLACAKRT